MEYQPALTIRDVPSLGIRKRIPGVKTPRPHHLLSKVESNWFTIYEWNPRVVEIREQVPLRPWSLIAQVSRRLGVAPPRGFSDEIPWTTDLLLTIRDPSGLHFAAVSCKGSRDVEKKRTKEKLEIERCYWTALGIPWGLATEKQLPDGLLRNLTWIQGFRRPGSFIPHQPERRASFLRTLHEGLRCLPHTPLVATCRAHDLLYGVATGESMNGVRYALAQRLWPATLHRSVGALEPPEFLLEAR